MVTPPYGTWNFTNFGSNISHRWFQFQFDELYLNVNLNLNLFHHNIYHYLSKVKQEKSGGNSEDIFGFFFFERQAPRKKHSFFCINNRQDTFSLNFHEKEQRKREQKWVIHIQFQTERAWRYARMSCFVPKFSWNEKKKNLPNGRAKRNGKMYHA